MRRSNRQITDLRQSPDILTRSGMTRGVVRFPILSWGWKAGLCALASALFYAEVWTGQDPAGADRSLLGKHINGVESVAFNPAGRWLASAGSDRSVYVWDLERHELAKVLNRAQASAETLTSRVAFAPDGSTLAVANDDGLVTLWDLASGIQRHNFRASTHGVRCLAFSPDGLVLATGSTDRSIVLWDMATLSRRATLSGSRGQVNSIAFSPDGRTLASGCTDGAAKLWDVSSGENIRTLVATTTTHHSVVCVAYSPDGQMLATACPESGVALWDATTGRPLEIDGGYPHGAMTLAFSPRGPVLAWGKIGGAIEIWDAAANRRLSVWRGHSGPVISLAFSPDGKTLASGGNDAAVRMWDVPLPDRAFRNPGPVVNGDLVKSASTAGSARSSAALATSNIAGESAEPTSHIRREPVQSRSRGRLAEQMDAPGWKLPADTAGVVVVYPQKLRRPTGPDAAFSATALVAEALGLDAAKDHDAVLEVVRAYIPLEKREEYGAVADRANPHRPAVLFDVERESTIFNRRDVRELLKKWDSGELNESSKGEREKVFAAMMNDLMGNLPPTGEPRGYRAIPGQNPRTHRVFPGDFPRISPEQLQEALDRTEGDQENRGTDLRRANPSR
jgi:WD40 repeat protein